MSANKEELKEAWDAGWRRRKYYDVPTAAHQRNREFEAWMSSREHKEEAQSPNKE